MVPPPLSDITTRQSLGIPSGLSSVPPPGPPAEPLEHVENRRCGGTEQEACQVAVDVAIESDLARPHETPIDRRLALGIEDRAGVLVECRRAVEVVLTDGRFGRAGVEVGEAAADPGVGLRRIPAAALALVAQFVHGGAAELPQMGTVARRANRPMVPAVQSRRVSIIGSRRLR